MSISNNINKIYQNKAPYIITVDRNFIEQQVVSLMLKGLSVRDIKFHLRDTLDYKLNNQQIQDIIDKAAVRANEIQKLEDLSGIIIDALDEIFKKLSPILVGICTSSLYCHTLYLSESRCADIWALVLLEAQEKCLNPKNSVADGGTGLRAGHALARPGVPCNGDVFHAIRDMMKELQFQTNRVNKKLHELYDIENKIVRAKNNNEKNELASKLAQARKEANEACHVVDTLAILTEWLRENLSITGPEYSNRTEDFDYIMTEMNELVKISSRIAKIRRKLQNQKDDLLRFVKNIDLNIEAIARHFNIDVWLVRKLFMLQRIPLESFLRAPEEARIRKQFKNQKRYADVEEAIENLIQATERTSSAVENFNSRLRPFIFHRKTFSQSFLDLLRFYLNHKPFERSARPERIGKSPSELLAGKAHPHYLEMLGYARFERPEVALA
jgi:predicted nucleic acid-binding protein